MGGRFWLGVVGVTIACAVAGFIGWMLIAGAWARWGFLGAFLFIGAIALFAGWLVDRRNERERAAY
jgi:hypothetical protein